MMFVADPAVHADTLKDIEHFARIRSETGLSLLAPPSILEVMFSMTLNFIFRNLMTHSEFGLRFGLQF